MGTKIEFLQNTDASTLPVATVTLFAGEQFPLVLFPGTQSPSKEIGYEVTNVDDVGTAIEPLFPKPEPGKLPQGSNLHILINNHIDLKGIMYQGEDTSVIARVTDTTNFF